MSASEVPPPGAPPPPSPDEALEELLRVVLGLTDSLVFEFDAEGRYLSAWTRTDSLLVLPREAFLGRHISESMDPQTAALTLESIQRVLARGQPDRFEYSVEVEGGRRWFSADAMQVPLRPGVAFLVRDITRQKTLELSLVQADRLAALGTLAAQLAHEIRNPLAAMRGSAQLLVQEPGGDPSSAKLVEILLRESDRLSKLVEDFLRFARPPPPVKQALELEVLVAETVDMLRADPLAWQVGVEMALAPLRVPVDADQLRQVLINILRNAFQAAAPGGQVRVTLEAADELALLRIWDSGGSIPVSDLSRIFEPFFSTREGGTGLGLSTAYSIVRAHGGNIRVSSSPREGTEFLIQLPLQG
mgnify:CR=1 FL=1